MFRTRYDTAVRLGDSLKAQAVELGFDLVGIAPAVPGRDLEFVREWLGRGYAGEMAYLSNPKRLDPSLILPSVQSVICVGLLYDTPLPYSTEVGSQQLAVGSKQQAEGRSQNSGFRSQDSGGPRTNAPQLSPSAGKEQTITSPQPSPSGRGWSAEGGSGEGAESQISTLRFPDANAAFRISDFDFPSTRATQPRAWISRYAWGWEYHELMREKLERLRAAIEELAPGAETRVFVDTGPISERAFARFSGLGWMGKNTCIINEGKGSWFFLGVILTSLAIEPDLPAPDRCGSCAACLDACPTGALVEPYVMDARRCISYLTIELKGSIPEDLRQGTGSNIFGCDICQDVCPWNGKNRDQVSGAGCQRKDFEPMEVSIQPSAVSDQQAQVSSRQLAVGRETANNFQSPPSTPLSSIQNPKSKVENPPDIRPPTPDTFPLFAPPLEALAAMTEAEFRRVFRRSPIRRATYRGWLRNLCVAMGNSGDSRFAPRLTELAAHPDPLVREHALWAIDRLAGLASTQR